MDFLEILSPRDTPLLNNLGTIQVHAGFVEYQEDTLAAAAANAAVEGAAASDPTLTTPARTASHVQNLQKHFQVSGRQIAVTHAGLSNMMAYQEMKALREIKNDLELALHRGSAVTGDTDTAPQFSGFLNRLTTNFSLHSGTTVTEKFFNDVLATAYANPVNLREGYGNINWKRGVNGFTSNVQRYIPAADRRTMDIIDVYEAEMGIIALFKSRYHFNGITGGVVANTSSFIVIDPDYFHVGWLRPFATQQLALDGDRERRFIVGECTLIARSEKAGVGANGVIPYLKVVV